MTFTNVHQLSPKVLASREYRKRIKRMVKASKKHIKIVKTKGKRS